MEKQPSTGTEPFLPGPVGSPERRLQTFHQQSWFFFFWQKRTKKSGEEKPVAGTLGPSMLSELLRPVSYGNQGSRMQSIAKQVTLAPTATHKTAKNPRLFGSDTGVTAKEKTKQRRE